MRGDAGDENNKRIDRDSADDDWDLIGQIGSGDQAALECLYKKYYSYLYRFVFQVTRRTDNVEEVINEVMFVVWEKAAAVVPRAKASTWILGIAHNKALQVMHRGRSIGTVDLDDESSADLARADEDTTVRELETEELLFTMLRALSPEQRAVMELVYFHGLHYGEIAQVIDCPENTVKTRVYHARRKLRNLWPGITGNKLPRINDMHSR